MLPLLSIKDLGIHFLKDGMESIAVDGLNMILDRGEILALVGESGSGKSVTALSILGLLPTPPARYSSGEILFSANGTDQTDLMKVDKSELMKIRGGRISMIFQEPMTSLNPVISCGRQVAEAIRNQEKIRRTEAKSKTVELFRKVELPDPHSIYNRFPHQLSGGQKQRVMIAMAMSGNPKLLIADEPTTALDASVQKTILDLIRKLQREHGMGVLFITHDLAVVSEFADKVAVMYHGKIVESGKVTEVFQNPYNPYTKALLACRPSIQWKGKRLPVIADFMDKEPEDLLRAATPHQRKNKPPDFHPLVEVNGLKVWFPKRSSLPGKSGGYQKAVDGVSFHIHAGETVGIVGESGCGKTTLGRTLLGLLTPTAGSISFAGQATSTINRKAWRELRSQLQVVFQDPFSSLNPRITIGEAISEPLRVHGSSSSIRELRDKVNGMMERVGLQADHYGRYPHEFSGGQRQRIGIARALILEPQFIVFDESVSALDVSIQAQVLNLLNDLKEEFGFTSLFISHDLSVVQYISDRIIVMNQGKIVEEGPSDQIFRHPKSNYTQKLVESMPKVM